MTPPGAPAPHPGALRVLQLALAIVAVLMIARGGAALVTGIHESAGRASGPYVLVGTQARLTGVAHVALGSFLGAAGLAAWHRRTTAWRAIAGIALAISLAAFAASFLAR